MSVNNYNASLKKDEPLDDGGPPELPDLISSFCPDIVPDSSGGL